MTKELFVPGRLCLFGEHSDWAGGYRRADKSIAPGHCMAIGTDQGIYANVSAHSDKFTINRSRIQRSAASPQKGVSFHRYTFERVLH